MPLRTTPDFPTWPYQINRASPQCRGLVGCWSAWEPRANTYWSDMSGRGNHGTVTTVGSAAYTPVIRPGAFRRGLRFNGGAAGPYFGYVGLQSIYSTLPLSVAVWFFPENANTNHPLFWTGTSNDWNGHYLIAGSGGSVQAATAQHASFATSGGRAYVANQWQHAVGIWSAANYRQAYLNGVADTADTTSKTPGSFAVSRFASVFTNIALTGSIAEARVYNRVLSGPEIMAMYAPQTRWDLYLTPRRRYFVPPPPVYVPRHGFIVYQNPGVA